VKLHFQGTILDGSVEVLQQYLISVSVIRLHGSFSW